MKRELGYRQSRDSAVILRAAQWLVTARFQLTSGLRPNWLRHLGGISASFIMLKSRLPAKPLSPPGSCMRNPFIALLLATVVYA
jgi:hypothetical protein